MEKEEPKQELPGIGGQTFKIVLDKKWFLKQETLEEGFDRIYNSMDFTEFEFASFKLGAKWQAERMYSEEEVKSLILQFNNYKPGNYDASQWFEQFKKK